MRPTRSSRIPPGEVTTEGSVARTRRPGHEADDVHRCDRAHWCPAMLHGDVQHRPTGSSERSRPERCRSTPGKPRAMKWLGIRSLACCQPRGPTRGTWPASFPARRSLLPAGPDRDLCHRRQRRSSCSRSCASTRSTKVSSSLACSSRLILPPTIPLWQVAIGITFGVRTRQGDLRRNRHEHSQSGADGARVSVLCLSGSRSRATSRLDRGSDHVQMAYSGATWLAEAASGWPGSAQSPSV